MSFLLIYLSVVAILLLLVEIHHHNNKVANKPGNKIVPDVVKSPVDICRIQPARCMRLR